MGEERFETENENDFENLFDFEISTNYKRNYLEIHASHMKKISKVHIIVGMFLQTTVLILILLCYAKASLFNFGDQSWVTAIDVIIN